MAAAPNTPDPRTRLGAYLTGDRRLYEVIGHDDDQVTLENCRTGYKLTVPASAIAAYRLVKPAPAVPDNADTLNQP